MEKKITIDNLAQMVAKGFEQTATKEDIRRLTADLNTTKADLGGKIDALDDKVNILDNKVNKIERDVSDVKDNLISKLDFEDLTARVKYTETKLGIESGK